MYFFQDKNENTMRCLEKRRQKIEKQIFDKESELRELQVHLESMDINVPSLPTIGNSGRITCSKCHHKGHRNQVNNPCNLQKCSSYTYCGIKEKHLEYFTEINKLKNDIKKKNNNIRDLQQQLAGLKNFASQSEHQFIKALTPRLIKVDPQYKMNKPKLLRDIRILRTFYSGKIPPEATNDSEQLRITLAKCKSTLANDIGDVAVHGIQEYEQSINDNNENAQNQNALNLNVNMNLSPVKVNDNGINNENINPENTCYFEADGDEKNNIKISHTKTSDRHKTKSRKHYRNRQRKKRIKHAEQISSSSSESESTSEDDSSSSSDDQGRGKKSIKHTRKKYLKLKEKFQHYRDQFKQADGPMAMARDMSVSQMYNSERPSNFSSPEFLCYGNNYQRFPSFVPTAYDNPPATQINPVAFNPNPYFYGSQICQKPLVYNYMQTPLRQTPFGNSGETVTTTSINNSSTSSTWHESNQPPQNELKDSDFQGIELLSSAVGMESMNTKQ